MVRAQYAKNGEPSQDVVYEYGPKGRRFAKELNNSQRYEYLYEGDEPIADYFIRTGGDGEFGSIDDQQTIVRSYVNGAGTDERLAYYQFHDATGALLAFNYYLTDNQGSIIGGVRSADGKFAFEKALTYDAYGNQPETQDGGQPFRYTGRRWDNETGLYYYRARYYSAVLGRFLQTDPIGYEDNMNLYAYTGNDPVNNTDPTGTCSKDGKTGLCPEAGDQAAADHLSQQLSDPDSAAAQVDAALQAKYSLTTVRFSKEPSGAETRQAVDSDGNVITRSDDGTPVQIAGAINISTEPEAMFALDGEGNSIEVDVPVDEKLEHEISHITDALTGAPNTGLEQIEASGAWTRPTEARAVNRTNQYRQRKGRNYQRQSYVNPRQKN